MSLLYNLFGVSGASVGNCSANALDKIVRIVTMGEIISLVDLVNTDYRDHDDSNLESNGMFHTSSLLLPIFQVDRPSDRPSIARRVP